MDEKDLQPNPEHETSEGEQPSMPEISDDALIGDLSGFSLVADETIQAVDELYGGIPPIEAEAIEDEYAGEEEDAALAVASVSDVTAQREAEREFVPPAFEPALPMPPMSRLRRGHLGSVVPALVLIALGAWLTLTTTAGIAPDPLLVAGAVVGGLTLTLLAQWIATGRWARGFLFFALVILLFAAVLFFAIQPGGLSLVRGWSLFVVALGVAITLSGVLARPVSRRLLQPGVLTIIAGLLGLIVSNNVLPQPILATAALWAPVVAVVLAVVLLLPLVFRRRG